MIENPFILLVLAIVMLACYTVATPLSGLVFLVSGYFVATGVLKLLYF